MKILVLGASGMLGNTLFRHLATSHEVMGTVRSFQSVENFLSDDKMRIFCNVDINTSDSIKSVLRIFRPDVVINCVGVIKQLPASKLHHDSIYVNSLLPHELLKLCEIFGAKLIHFSTDCVFSGDRGGYLEGDFADANDLYGRSKYLGEVGYSKNAITLRTSIIGHELNSSKSLVDWFLTQKTQTNGYSEAVFSGLPTVEVARVLLEHVLPNLNVLSGLYHLSVNPIDKYNLLNLVAKQYKKTIEITEDSNLKIDRSLNSQTFQRETGYTPPSWPELIEYMHKDYINFFENKRNYE